MALTASTHAVRRALRASLVCLIAYLGVAAQAADISYGAPDASFRAKMMALTEHHDPGNVLYVPDYHIVLRGEIVPGDADKIQEFITYLEQDVLPQRPDHVKRIALLDLDSPGGSFQEAIKIAQLLDRSRIPTFIGQGATCLSACAVIFMAGTEQFPEGAETHQRMVELPVTLGFHRPFIQEFAADIPPEVLKELSGDEIQEIFTDEYLLAFDLANQLIQEMLAVDPDAWNNDLLVRMLTATDQQEDGRFVYLSTVDDVLSWDVGVINVAPRLGSSPAERYTAAFWLCVNAARRLEFPDKRFWARPAQAHETLLFNISPLINVDAALNWLPARMEEDGKTFNIEMESLGSSGCKVTVNRDANSVRIEMITQGGPTSQLYLDNFRDALLPFDPALTLANLPLRKPGAASLRMDGLCFVFRDSAKIDEDPCQKITDTDDSGRPVEIYVWPSGARTVFSRDSFGDLINGNAAKLDFDRQQLNGLDVCYFNTSSGNTFCFKDPF